MKEQGEAISAHDEELKRAILILRDELANGDPSALQKFKKAVSASVDKLEKAILNV